MSSLNLNRPLLCNVIFRCEVSKSIRKENIQNLKTQDLELPERWIGTNGPTQCPIRLSNITPLDSPFRGYIKGRVFEIPISDTDTMLGSEMLCLVP